MFQETNRRGHKTVHGFKVTKLKSEQALIKKKGMQTSKVTQKQNNEY